MKILKKVCISIILMLIGLLFMENVYAYPPSDPRSERNSSSESKYESAKERQEAIRNNPDEEDAQVEKINNSDMQSFSTESQDVKSSNQEQVQSQEEENIKENKSIVKPVLIGIAIIACAGIVLLCINSKR